ncbi:MAG: DUF29 domain-containing protein [Cyanobacteria bacterium P01_G01_bin.19]
MTYTTNYDLWLEEQISHLKSGEYSSIDVVNLVGELEALGRAEKSAVKSLVYQILLHMLLIDYWHEESKYNKNHWLAEIDAFQLQLEDRLTTNLINLAKENLPRLYAKARLNAIRKSSLPEDRYPEQCPYTIEKIIN